ncbi:MAG: 50S ribosomal protein L23, partial [Pseudomonadota bacterium]|nr:50S ribosomal protein L23 [Pseudomonadota bacterium]
MTKAALYDVIRKPIITEKATMASENGAVVFEVAIDSNKPQIKEAVESLLEENDVPQKKKVAYEGKIYSLVEIEDGKAT